MFLVLFLVLDLCSIHFSQNSRPEWQQTCVHTIVLRCIPERRFTDRKVDFESYGNRRGRWIEW